MNVIPLTVFMSGVKSDWVFFTYNVGGVKFILEYAFLRNKNSSVTKITYDYPSYLAWQEDNSKAVIFELTFDYHRNISKIYGFDEVTYYYENGVLI